MKRFTILFLCIVGIGLSVHSQTVVWKMRPSDYNDITRINNNLYKVTRNGKIGLINADGTIVAPAEYDKISDYYEQKALVPCADSRGERVAGCLTEEGKFYSFSKKYYTLEGQQFYSDNVLSVADENGNVGYIDYQGREILGFDGKYDKIKPFVEGYAAVYKNKKYFLIDKDGTPVRFSFNTIASVYGGTNVYNGTVYVWDTNGKFYTYNVKNGGACKGTKAPSNKSFDYLYRFAAITGKSKNVPFTSGTKSGKMGLQPAELNGAYGYQDGENAVLPCQLSSAQPFEDGYAIVGLNGKLGILRYVDGSVFGVTQPENKFSFYEGNSVTCKFNLSIPSVWRSKNMTVILKDENDTRMDLKNDLDNYTFLLKPDKTMTKNYRITVYAEELKLFESMLTYSFTKKEIPKPVIQEPTPTPKKPEEAVCPTCKKRISACEYKGKHPVEKKCPTCGKKISECKYQGVH